MISSTKSGYTLFMESIFPSLFSFLIIVNILFHYESFVFLSRYFGKMICLPFRLSEQCSMPIVVSFICGYPFGAKYSSKLYLDGLISNSEYTRLINIASNPSPAFIVGFIGIIILKNVTLSYLLILSLFLSSFFMSLILPVETNNTFKIQKSKRTIKHFNNSIIFSHVFKLCVEDAIKSSASIGAIIIFFSVITSLITNVFFNIGLKHFMYNNDLMNFINMISLSVIEITNGIKLLISTYGVTIYTIFLLGFLTGFGGISILVQCALFIYNSNINFNHYCTYKFIQGLISGIFFATFYFVYKAIHPSILQTTMSTNEVAMSTTIIVQIVFFIFIFFIHFLARKLFHTS